MTRLSRRALATGLALGLTGALIAAAYLANGRAAVQDASVTIHDFRFEPPTVIVAAGATVAWTNRDDDPHTVTSAGDPTLLASPPLDTGASYRVRFEKPGTYHYFCSVHPHMQGTVIVR
jgi:plastocyanin